MQAHTIDQERRQELLDKIAALLEMTEKNGCTEAEAENAADKAQVLMDKYGLSISDLKAASPTDICGSEATHLGKRRAHEVQYCCYMIATFTQTMSWFRRSSTEIHIHFFGIKNDVSIATYLFKTIRQAMDFEWSAWCHANRDFTYSSPQTARKQFMTGMASRINTRLKTLVNERAAHASEGNDCRALVVLKDQIVTKAFSELNLKFRTSRRRSRTDRTTAAFAAGSAAGARVSFNQTLK
jgi:hypothetical protein